MKTRSGVLSLLCVLACTSGVMAGLWRPPVVSDHLWLTTGNWSGGYADYAGIDKPDCLINAGSITTANMYIGATVWGGGQGNVVMTGGSLNVAAAQIGYDTIGTFTMSGGTVSSTGGTYFAQNIGGNGTLEINGGTYTENAYLYFSNGGSNAHIKLYGGTLALNGGMQALNAAGQIDIMGTGKMLWTGDHVADLGYYANIKGYITTSEAGKTIDINYDGTKTTVQLIPEPATLAMLALGSIAFLRGRRK